MEQQTGSEPGAGEDGHGRGAGRLPREVQVCELEQLFGNLSQSHAHFALQIHQRSEPLGAAPSKDGEGEGGSEDEPAEPPIQSTAKVLRQCMAKQDEDLIQASHERRD